MPGAGILQATSMLRQALPVLLVILGVAADQVRLVEKTECQLKPAWSSSSEDLHKLAYSWSKTHDVSRWEYTTGADDCSQVFYDTRVHIPSFFLEVWKKSTMQIHIDKRVCVRGRRLRETLVISNIPFVEDVSIRVEASAGEKETSLSAEYSLSVPWYLAFVETQVLNHVRASVLEYLHILQLDICEAR
jgi:hypothetical protein